MTDRRESAGLVPFEEELERAKTVLNRRAEIMGAPLPPDALLPNPIALFEQWFEDARGCGVEMPETMTIATVDEHGIPTIRNISMRGRDDVSFHFWTNSKSTKGRGLSAQGRTAVLFNWIAIRRQVKVTGPVDPSEELSDAFWTDIPPIVQAALDNAQQVDKRGDFAAKMGALTPESLSQPIARPESFVAFRLYPDVIEFWQQGYHNLLGDRFRYTRGDPDVPARDRTPDDAWELDALSPW